MNQPRDAKGRFCKKSDDKKYESFVAYKGFDLDLRCRGMQYEIGKVASVKGRPVLCENGLHFCVNPLDVLSYYEPLISRYCVVKPQGLLSSRTTGTTKQCTTKLLVERELDITEFCRSIEAYYQRNTPELSSLHNEVYSHFVIQKFSYDPVVEVSDAYDACTTRSSDLSLTLRDHSVCRANDSLYSIAIARGRDSVASADIAIVTNANSIARSVRVLGLAYCAKGGHAVTEAEGSVAVSFSGEAAITLKETRSIGILTGGIAYVNKPGCTLIIRDIWRIKRLYLADDTTLLIEDRRRSDTVRNEGPVMLITGKDIKRKEGSAYYTSPDVRAAYDKKIKEQRNENHS